MSLDRKELKIQALRERISTLTTDYEEKVADLRVELTVLSEEREQQMQEKDQQIRTLGQRIAELEAQEPVVVEGEIVQENEEDSDSSD